MSTSEVKLNQEIENLRTENKHLRKKLDAKRYKAIDGVVDTFYKVVRLGRNPRQKVGVVAEDTKLPKPVSVKKYPEKLDKKRVDIINVNFFDWSGKTKFLGGAERYVYDLACLLKQLGYKPRILQGANFDFKKKCQGIDVIGVRMEDKAINAMSRVFADVCADAGLIISSPLELACELDVKAPVVAINHGVNFDHPKTSFKNTSGADTYYTYQLALERVAKCICVDTNFINWLRTRDYKLSQKLIYIPNYYDPMVFGRSMKKSTSEKLRFVYPRRIYEARGADLAIAAFDKILQRYVDKVELYMVGQIDNDKIGTELTELMKKYPKNVFHVTYEPAEMHKAYSCADVSIIPTKYSEGTSLSCIESMASKTAIIATNVGGLPNLIIDGYNGLLISPTCDDLIAAVEDLIRHPKKRRALAENGYAVARTAFSKNVWETSWKVELAEILK